VSRKPSRCARKCCLAVSCYSGGLWPNHIGVIVPAYLVQRLGVRAKTLQAIPLSSFATVRSRGATLQPDNSQVRERFGAVLDVALLLSALS
jgi:hypothetical protein